MSFTLDPSFLLLYVDTQPIWGHQGFSYVVFKDKYALPIYEENRTEEFWECVARVVQGTFSIQKEHCERLRLPWSEKKAQKSAQEMFRRMWGFKFLPPGRGLKMMGTDAIRTKGSAALNNCAFISTTDLAVDFADPFCFLADMSMLGVGVGGDTKGAGSVKILPPCGIERFVIPDTREGWVDLIRRTLNAYVGKGSLPVPDYSEIRPYGMPIKGMGGTASGPAPLKQLYDDLHEILAPLVGRPITSTAIVDLFNAIGRCVVSGNVRRTAEIMFGDPSDDAFLNLKNPEVNSAMLSKWRWTSNNSVFVKTGDNYSALADMTAKNGEPGFMWLDNARDYGRMIDLPDFKDHKVMGANPCAEQSLESYELCCLVETFPTRHDDLTDFLATLKMAYMYAKTVTLLPTHDARTNSVMLRNRRIGTSQSGIVQNIARVGLREHLSWSDSGYAYLQKLDRIYSDWLCVPRSIKMTSVKPSGTVSLLPGSTPGIHYPYGEYYWRTMRFDNGSPMLSALREAGYRVFKAEGANTSVVYFPIHETNFQRSNADVTMWEQLELAAQMQAYWADNQVSVTVTFKPDEAKDIPRALEMYETRLKSVSFLPLTDHGYEHAPYQKMSRAEYEESVASLKPLVIAGTKSSRGESEYCDNDSCVIS